MTVIVTTYPEGSSIEGEQEFEIQVPYDDEEGYQSVRIHPWARYRSPRRTDREVFIAVGNYNPDGSEWEDSNGGEPVWNIIVDREDFVEGLLATFSELKRA